MPHKLGRKQAAARCRGACNCCDITVAHITLDQRPDMRQFQQHVCQTRQHSLSYPRSYRGTKVGIFTIALLQVILILLHHALNASEQHMQKQRV